MQTGLTLSRYLDQKVGAAYTGFLDSTKKNRLFKDALISIIERVYKADYDQKQWDEISTVTKTQYVVPVQNNIIQTAPITITAISYGFPYITITTAVEHGLVVGQTVTLQNVAGLTASPAINGTAFTIDSITPNTITFIVASSAGAYTVNSGQLLSSYYLSDYWHLLSIKLKYASRIYNVSVDAASNTSPIKVDLDVRTNLRTGDRISIAGVVGNTNANGTFYIKVLNDFKISLYSDIHLQTAVAGNGKYLSGGTVSRVSYFYASPLTSSMKIGVLNIPTAEDPFFEIADNKIKLYPTDPVCTEVTVDYIRQPNIVIDVTDTTTDLTTFYPEKFLFAIVDEAAILFANIVRDLELNQTTTQEQNKNP